MNYTDALDKYAEVTEVIKALEDQKKVLNQIIVSEMNNLGMTNEQTTKGKFLLAWRKNWEYSMETQLAEVLLQETKKREQNDGTAKVGDQTEYLKFLPLKEPQI